MKDIVIYSKGYCPFCHAAKDLLSRKGANFTEIDITGDNNLRAEMLQKANGRHTVPQIFIGDTHVGGYDELAALDRNKKLDPLLGA